MFWVTTSQLGHVHAGAIVPFIDKLVLPLDTLGVLIALVAAVQLMTGSRLARLRASFHPIHIGGGLTLLGLAVVHGTGTTLHALQPPVLMISMLLVTAGAALVALAALMVITGYRLAKDKRIRAIHSIAAVALGALVATHGVMGVLHTFTG